MDSDVQIIYGNFVPVTRTTSFIKILKQQEFDNIVIEFERKKVLANMIKEIKDESK